MNSLRKIYLFLLRSPTDAMERAGKENITLRIQENLVYFTALCNRFEAKDISYIRRIRLSRTLLIIIHATDKNLNALEREDGDKVVSFMHSRYHSYKSKADFIIDFKHLWKQLFPERDERDRIDDTIMPYAVRHLSGKVDNRLLKILEKEVEKEKARKKKKKVFGLRKEKRLSYYLGWSRGKSIETKEKTEKQTKLT